MTKTRQYGHKTVPMHSDRCLEVVVESQITDQYLVIHYSTAGKGKRALVKDP